MAVAGAYGESALVDLLVVERRVLNDLSWRRIAAGTCSKDQNAVVWLGVEETPVGRYGNLAGPQIAGDAELRG